MGLFRCLLYFPFWPFFLLVWFPARVFQLHMAAGFEGMAKRGCSRYIFLGCMERCLSAASVSRECGEAWGTENKQNGTWSSLTCIIFFFPFFFFLGFNGWHSHCRCMFLYCVGGYVHIACGKVSAVVIIIPMEIVYLFVSLSYCTFS